MHAFHGIGHPVRRRVLELLAEGPHTAGALVAQITAEFGIGQSAVSQHLGVLRAHGLVARRAEGTRRIYRLDATPLAEAARWLSRFRPFWENPLDALAVDVARGPADSAEPQSQVVQRRSRETDGGR